MMIFCLMKLRTLLTLILFSLNSNAEKVYNCENEDSFGRNVEKASEKCGIEEKEDNNDESVYSSILSDLHSRFFSGIRFNRFKALCILDQMRLVIFGVAPKICFTIDSA